MNTADLVCKKGAELFSQFTACFVFWQWFFNIPLKKLIDCAKDYPGIGRILLRLVDVEFHPLVLKASSPTAFVL